jgi:hypothetical protein
MHVWQRPKPLTGVLWIAAILGAALLMFAGMKGSILGLALVLGVAVTVFVLMDWTVGVPLLILVGSVDGFLKHLTASPFAFILKDALLALMLLGLVGWLALDRNARPDNVRWRGALVWGVYVAFMLTQILHPASSLAGGMGAFRGHAMFAILFVVGAIYFRNGERLPKLANLVIVACSIAAVGAIAEHALGERWMALSPGFMKASLHYQSFASEAVKAAGNGNAAIFRMYGTLVDPAALGVACAYGMLFAMAAMARLRGFARIATIASIPLMGLGLALSQSRASMGGLATGMLLLVVLMLARKATRGFALAAVLLIVAAVPAGVLLTHGSVADRVLASDQVAYAQKTRDTAQEIVLNGIGAYPFGHGLGATGSGGGLRDDTGLAVDNVFYANLYETGFLGLGLFLLVQITFIALGVRAAVRAKGVVAQTAFIGIVAGQIALLTSCWFSQGGFDYAPVGQCFWIFAGAVARQDAWA